MTFLVKEGISLDRDKAKAAVESEIGTLEDENLISYTEFTRIFCRGIFKQAMIRSAESFNTSMNTKKDKLKDMTLKQKLSMYQRSNIVAGLMAPGTDHNTETKQILDNINLLNEKDKDPVNAYIQSRQSYVEFLKNP